MCLLGIVERPGVSWGVLGCPGVIRFTQCLNPQSTASSAQVISTVLLASHVGLSSHM